MKNTALILISHGKMAEEALKSAQMIVGNIEGAFSISMDEKEGADGIRKKIREVVNDLKSYERILVMVDIIGGTPSNVAVMELCKLKNVMLISGFNLGMILEFATSSLEDNEKLKEHLIEVGRNGIRDVFKEITKIETD